MTTPQPLLIIADNYQLAQTYAREHQLGYENISWRYAYTVHHAQGLHPGRYVTISRGHCTGRDLQARIELGQHLRTTGWTYGAPE